MSDMTSIYHLFGRYPQVGAAEGFSEWLKKYGASMWYEDHIENLRRIYVVSRDEQSVFVAEIDRSHADVDNFDRPELFPVVSAAVFDTSALPALAEVRKRLQSDLEANSKLIAARYKLDNRGQMDVVAEFIDGKGVVFERSWTKSETRELRHVRNELKPLDRIIIGDDSLAINDIHAPYLFQPEATTWTQGPLTIREKARRICFKVYETYRYDSAIYAISEFTWRDTLVRDQNGRAGICDEFAVVQISYLRSIGIPARMKFLIWNQGGQGVGHACLEFKDVNNAWVHMDGLWQAFDNPGRYRASGASNVTVMDGDYPMDSRSNTPAWGLPDTQGDGKLYPYGDFIINPGYPGNQRPGYSY